MTDNQCTGSDRLREYANSLLYELAQRHGLRLAELVTTSKHRTPELAAARREFCRAMRATVVYADPPAGAIREDDTNYRRYLLRSEVEADSPWRWRPVSTVDIARCIAANHATVVIALKQDKPTAAPEGVTADV